MLKFVNDINLELKRKLKIETSLVHRFINCYNIIWEAIANIVYERGNVKGFFRIIDNIIFYVWFYLHQIFGNFQ